MASRIARRVGRGVASLAAVAGVMALPTTAQAAGHTYENCHSGQACLYGQTGLNGSPGVRAYGNWQGAYQAGSILNNGTRYVGADHVRYRGTVSYADGSYRGVTGCLHWYDGGNRSGASVSFVSGTTLTSMTWGGECGPDEPVRKYGPRYW